MSIPIGSIVEKYQIVRKLGSGGMADVYVGLHTFTQKQAAIKVLNATVSIDSDPAKAFKQEAVDIARFDHPNIIPIVDCGFTPDNQPYIAMELCKMSLAERIGTRVLSLEEVLEYAMPIAQALFYIHNFGPDEKYVHRDVKPENVLIDNYGKLLLADFGILVTSITGEKPGSQPKPRNVIGTPPYMPPEQFTGEIRRATDQYALAVMIYQWLCGHLPFRGKDFTEYGALHTQRSIPSFATYGATIDPEIEHVVHRALAKNPDDRYPTILDFVRALENIQTKRIHQAQEAREQAQRQKDEEVKRQQEAIVQGLKNQLVQANSQLQALQREVEEKRQQEAVIQNLTTQLDERDKRILFLEQFTTPSTDNQAELKKLQTDIEVLIQERNQLNARVTSLQEVLNAKKQTGKGEPKSQKQTTDANQQAIEALIQERNQLNARVTSLQEVLNAKKQTGKGEPKSQKQTTDANQQAIEVLIQERNQLNALVNSMKEALKKLGG